MSEYKRVHRLYAARPQAQDTAEDRFWKSFKRSSQEHKNFGPVTCLDISPVGAHDIAATSSKCITLYCGRTHRQIKTFKRFAGQSASGRFRADGNLLVCGDGSTVKVHDVARGALLRALKGHTAAINVTRFSVPQPLRIFSAGNDKTVRFWDLTAAKSINCFEGHTDYIRCASESPTSGHGHIWATGAYDHTIRIWDMRTGSASNTGTGTADSMGNSGAGKSTSGASSMLMMDHGDPVEAVLHVPAGGLLVSAGGPRIKIWDLAGGGRLLQTLENHQKTVTGLCFDAGGQRLLSAGADGHIKVFDTASYDVCHGLKYNGPILALALSPDSRTLAAGMASGTVAIRSRPQPVAANEDSDGSMAQGSTHRYAHGTSQRNLKRGYKSQLGPRDQQVLLLESKKRRRRPHDDLLRKFQYREALDSALSTNDPVETMAVMDELVYRRGLNIALQNRDEADLIPLLKFLVRYTTLPRYSKLLLQVCNDVLDLYASMVGQSVSVDEQFFQLQRRVAVEVGMQTKLAPIQGSIETLITASMSQTPSN